MTWLFASNNWELNSSSRHPTSNQNSQFLMSCSKRYCYDYIPKNIIWLRSKLRSYSATFTFKDTLRSTFLQVTLYYQKVCFQARVKLRLHSKIRSYAYVSKYILSKTLLNPSRFPSPKIKKLSLWIILQGPPVNICLAENTVQNFFTIQKFSWALGISLQHFKFIKNWLVTSFC